jgi:hypothetical protein
MFFFYPLLWPQVRQKAFISIWFFDLLPWLPHRVYTDGKMDSESIQKALPVIQVSR